MIQFLLTFVSVGDSCTVGQIMDPLDAAGPAQIFE